MKNIPIMGDPKQLMLLRTRAIGETDLIYRDGKWFLYATIEAPEAPLAEAANGFLGVDMGIVKIATSTGEKASGARLNSYRKRQVSLRKRLQARKTSSARRLGKSGAARRRGSPPTSITRSLNASWPRLDAPDVVSPSKN